jgi:hypothetical protein
MLSRGIHNLPKDKFLVVTLVNHGFGEGVYFYLFDTTPYYIQKEEEKRRTTEKAREKIRF